jgi:hypothetical protein
VDYRTCPYIHVMIVFVLTTFLFVAQEFVSGMGKLSCDSIETLKAQLASFNPGFMIHSTFRDFYRCVVCEHYYCYSLS